MRTAVEPNPAEPTRTSATPDARPRATAAVGSANADEWDDLADNQPDPAVPVDDTLTLRPQGTRRLAHPTHSHLGPTRICRRGRPSEADRIFWDPHPDHDGACS